GRECPSREHPEGIARPPKIDFHADADVPHIADAPHGRAHRLPLFSSSARPAGYAASPDSDHHLPFLRKLTRAKEASVRGSQWGSGSLSVTPGASPSAPPRAVVG